MSPNASGFPSYFPSCQALDIAGGAGGRKLVKKAGLKGNKAGNKNPKGAEDDEGSGTEESDDQTATETMTTTEAYIKHLRAQMAVVKTNPASGDATFVATLVKVEAICKQLADGQDVFQKLASQLNVKSLQKLQSEVDTYKKLRNPKRVGKHLAQVVLQQEMTELQNRAEVAKERLT